MRPSSASSSDVPVVSPLSLLRILKKLAPYIGQFRGRVFFAMSCLVLAKLANVMVPLALKEIVDDLTLYTAHQDVLRGGYGLGVWVLAMVIAYGLLRLASTAFGELRDAIFAKVTQRIVREASRNVFSHLHRLSVRFHLNRPTGGVSRDIERGTRGISFLLSFMLFNILPTLAEIALVTGILLWKYRPIYALVIIGTLLFYIVFTLAITEWRMVLRRTMNELDSRANTHAIDSLLNYETVKYFGNEGYEATRYDLHLSQWENAAVRNQTSLALLNAGQSLIIACGVTVLMALVVQDVLHASMTIGDLVLVNAYMLQLYLPLHFLGFVYREIKHSVADQERMFALLDQPIEITDQPGASPLRVSGGEIRFEKVDFYYEADRPLLKKVDITIPAGTTLAIVGSTGSGKSTIGRLLFRLYDPRSGCIRIDGQDIRAVTVHSLRQAIGVVPQDTVLFNDTIAENIAYGRPGANLREIQEVAQQAQIHGFISSLPHGYQTQVGERGLKLSGGEKQRVAIARMLLKNPPIMIFDEATSALDSVTEKEIQTQLHKISQGRTTIVIAHRLSTVSDADHIVVLEQGTVVEQGSHSHLLQLRGRYSELWKVQQEEEFSKNNQETLATD